MYTDVICKCYICDIASRICAVTWHSEAHMCSHVSHDLCADTARYISAVIARLMCADIASHICTDTAVQTQRVTYLKSYVT